MTFSRIRRAEVLHIIYDIGIDNRDGFGTEHTTLLVAMIGDANSN